MKRILSTVLILLQLLALSAFANAAAPRIVDSAGLLDDSEIAILETRAQQLVETYEMDVVIVTTESLEQTSSEAFADDYYDDNGYGIGSEGSGVLLLLSMEYRDWAISTCGEGIYALTDYGIQNLFASISDDLSRGAYFEAFSSYLDSLEIYYESYRSGHPLDGTPGKYNGQGSYTPGTQEETYYYNNTVIKDFSWYFRKFVISLAIGAAVAGITLLIMRSKMNTVRLQRDASSYLSNGDVQITMHRDVFLYSHISKTKKQTQTSGGSSVHRSSGGRSHGGGHGKF